MRISKLNIPLNYDSPFWKEFSFLKGYIMRELGSPLVRVELTEDMLSQSIHDAIHQFMKYEDKAFALDVQLTTIDQEGYADIPADIDKNLIRDVLFEESTNQFGFSTPLGEGVVATFPLRTVLDFAGGSFDVGNYYMMKQNLETANSVLGLKRVWEIMGNKIKVSPRKGDSYRNIAILYSPVIQPKDFEEDEWIRLYAVECAKLKLGIIRRKFSGFAASGGPAASDGEALITEAKTEQEKLIATIKENRPSIPMQQF